MKFTESSGQIHIAVGFDQNYFKFFCTLAASLIDNHKESQLHIHAIAGNLGQSERIELKTWLEKSGHKITFWEIDQQLLEGLVLTGKWTLAVYYRLFFPLLLKNKVSRLIYLDTDTIVCRSLSRFYNFPIENFPVAAVYDNYVKTQPLIGIEEPGNYFNSGVLLIDTDKWNENQISEKTISYLREYPENIRFVDQCALNAVLKNNWFKLPESFNLLHSYVPGALTRQELKDLKSSATVIHFNLDRPWYMLSRNRLRSLYFHYKNANPFTKSQPDYVDYSFTKIPSWVKVRVVEFYLESGWVRKIYKQIKITFFIK
jgi:lipopolysaccharide biosynthesis glycosyltransferase